jgi:hypothetical protein
MDVDHIERLRRPGFTLARRGYDRREVDNLLGSLIDWLESEAPGEIGDLAVKRKLELVGRSTSRIMQTAEEESSKLRQHVVDECEELRAEADEAAKLTRQAADDYAKKTRAKTDQDARRAAEAAEAKAAQIVEEGERRRAEIEWAIGELENRRGATIEELDALQAHLASAIGTHRSGARPKQQREQREQPPQPEEAKERSAVTDG